MSEMIERVARAILRAELLNKYSDDDGTVTNRTNEEWPLWVDNARAAIEAMREPTEEMVEAHDNYPFMPEAMDNMINAALSKVDA